MVLSEATERTFAGTKSEQELAAGLFRLLAARGRFMAVNSPIRVSADAALAYLKETHKRISDETITRIVDLNPDIFSIEEIDGQRSISTTRAGRASFVPHVDQRHTFADRLMEPKPKSEYAESTLRPRPRMDSSWSIYDRMLSDYGATTLGPTQEIPTPVVEDASPAAPFPSDDVLESSSDTGAARTIDVPAASASTTDISGVDDKELEAALMDRLSSDPRVAQFGGQWMIDDRVPRFSKGELRKLKDYIVEQEQPLTDDVLVQDVLDVRPRATDFELMRFALNYRLSKEHREFDFVGTSGQKFWSTSGLPPIGTVRRKPTEIGSDFRYLLEELPAKPSYRSVGEVSHVLTFYEFTLGLLPFNPEIQSLLPAPVVPNQRSAVLTFECPQAYTTYLVELRYPTPNRGGFVVGLDDFYTENLVPGALLSIKATENDGQYVVEYVSAASQSERLIELDDRRQRYVFRPTSFNCGVIEDQLLTEDRWSALSGEKPVDDKIRRRPEAVVATTFERLGRKLDGGGYSASFSELFAGANIERPFSEALLRSILTNDDSGAFAKDPDGPDDYTYIPGSSA